MIPQTDDASLTRDLLRETVSATIADPEALELSVVEAIRRGRPVNVFSMRVSASDHGRVLGKGGCRIKALQRITGEAGKRAGGFYILALEDPPPGEIRPRPRPKTPQEYDADPAATLLQKTIELTLPGSAWSLSTEAEGDEFVFTISALDTETYSALLAPAMSTIDGTLAYAIDSLLHARAAREGVAFRLRVVRG